MFKSGKTGNTEREKRAKLLIRIGGIISAVEPLIVLLYLIMINSNKTLIFIPAVLIGFWVYKTSEDVINLIDAGVYEKAKNKLIFPIVAAFLIVSRIAGVMFAVGYFMI